MPFQYPLRIQIHQPHTSFTNLDEISGQVILSLTSQETIAGITVKLEGESRTRLAGTFGGPGTYDPYAKDQTQLEVHKLLYKVLTVFPTPDNVGPGSKNQYTLSPGQYEYPFRFKIPFNNDCINNNSHLANLSSMRMDMTQAHVKMTLPPTLSGLPGEAEILYFVKATVQRPAFYKENWRNFSSFMFFPIEPPRPPPNRRETYARVHHQFAPPIDLERRTESMWRKKATAKPTAGVVAPSISMEGRLPDPPIITCNQALPLRILITRLNESTGILYLQMLHIELVAYNAIRAHQLRRNEISSWTILSTSNMKTPFGESENSNNVGKKVIELSSGLWQQRPLPNNVSPTFHTCNISRTYALHIKLGISWGMEGEMVEPEMNIQQLRMPVQVYSGIAPPQAVLAAMSNRPTAHSSNSIPPPVPSRPSAAGAYFPTQSQPRPTQTSDHIEPSPEDIPPDAPPSYEDAIADNVGPIDGPRAEYRQNEPSTDTLKDRGGLFADRNR